MLPRISLKSFLKSTYPLVNFLYSIFHYLYLYLKSPVKIILTSFLFLVFASGGLFYWFILRGLPSPTTLSSQPISLTTHIRDRHGTELYKIYASQNRTLIKLTDLPLYLRQAIISIEDKDFYRHVGFSPSGTIRAAWRILTNERLEGGSTITQQLVKTSLLSPERTLPRKLKELVLSVVVERLYSKDTILEMYLNRIPFGGSSYGIEEASQTYFGIPAAKLTLGQAALLAGLPASPTTYSPYGAHPEMAKTRQKEVLRRMVADGYISWDQAETASNEDLVFKAPISDIKAPHFVMYIKSLLAEQFGPDVVENGGLDVTTSLDLGIQEQAQQIVADEIASLNYLHITNGAALVTHPATGEILAMVGSHDYFDLARDGNVNLTISPRQPGSSIKPINYALAFSKGFSPASLIDDSPITYRSPGSPDYTPVNYDNRYHGKVTLRSALANSYNVPAVKLLSANGVNNMLDLGEKMGITTWKDRSRFGLSLTLGGGEVTMVDMAVVYGVFANYGQRVDLHPILSVKDSSGRILKEFRCPQKVSLFPHVLAANPNTSATEITSCPSVSVLDPKIAFFITDILSDNAARTPTFGPRSDLFIDGRQVAAKTGTTNNLRDNWTIGFTPNRLVAVWVGNNDNSPMSYVASGITGASPIWKKIMTTITKDYPPLAFSPPSGLVLSEVCSPSGNLHKDYYISGLEPKSSACPTPSPSLAPPEANYDKLLRGHQTKRP